MQSTSESNMQGAMTVEGTMDGDDKYVIRVHKLTTN